VQEARAFLSIARSDLYPSLDYDGSVSRSNATPGILGGVGAQAPETSNFYSGTLTASWELDIWGRIRRSNEAARATLFATEDARRGVWLTLVSDLAQAYFELLALDVRLQIARNSTEAYQRTYDLFLDRFNLGVASKLETSRAQGALGDAQATIPQLESDIVAKENQISILLGKIPGSIPRGKPMYEQPVVPVVPAGLPSTLLERRPDLRQAEQQLVSANARIGIAKAEFFPRLSLTALLGTASTEVSALTGGTATVWAVAGTFSGPLFNAGRTLGNYRASIAQWEQARLQYEQAVLTALREVSDALTALGKLNEAETGQDTAVKALDEAVEHATNRYRQGLASYYEVLEAEQQLYPAQNALAQIRRNRLLAYVQLYKALGGGWSLTDAEWAGQDQARAR
jgi:outer membrane protein, multidrug efflux system